ncbi:MAG: hypothetical protein C5S38_01880 [Candidatus Methanophagaceae archaeon]|nr:MAG: hypothetical protein C5S38_01880 [Methanophagales archaeon]KAF5436285.1 hypothetical protein C5S36_00855 [Methanophagales archaeon]
MLCNRWGKGGKWWKGISGQKGYGKADTVAVMEGEKEKLRAHKIWYTSLYNKLFGWQHQKKKSKYFYIPLTNL